MTSLPGAEGRNYTVFIPFVLFSFSYLSGRYLRHPLSKEAEIWGQKRRFALAKTIFFILLLSNKFINYLIVIDLLITYLFSFSSAQNLGHLLSLESDIWTRRRTRDFAVKSIFDLLIHQL